MIFLVSKDKHYRISIFPFGLLISVVYLIHTFAFHDNFYDHWHSFVNLKVYMKWKLSLSYLKGLLKW